MTDTQLTITKEGQRALFDMRGRVVEIGSQYGYQSEEYVKALESLLDNVLNVFRLGGRVDKDFADLSLIVQSFILYAVIWHPKYIDGNKRDPLLGDWSCHS